MDNSRFRRIAAAAALVLFVGGCGAEDAGGDLAGADGSCQAVHDHLVGCGLGGLRTTTGDCTGSAEALELSCEELALAYDDAGIKDDGFLLFGIEENGLCLFNIQCEGELVCIPIWDNVAGVFLKQCGPKRARGENCDSGGDCIDDDSACRPDGEGAFSVCLPPGQLDEACRVYDHCDGELVCRYDGDAGACAEPLERGSTCVRGACERGDACRPTNGGALSCQDKADAGESCLRDAHCDSGFFTILKCSVAPDAPEGTEGVCIESD